MKMAFTSLVIGSLFSMVASANVVCSTTLKGPFNYDQHLTVAETESSGSEFYSARSSDLKISVSASYANDPADNSIIIAADYGAGEGGAAGTFDLASKSKPSLSLYVKQGTVEVTCSKQ